MTSDAPAGESVPMEVLRGLIANVLGAQSFDGRDELLAQVPCVKVTAGPLTFLKLAVDPSEAAPSSFATGSVPGQAWVLDERGGQLGTLFVWVEVGYISALEYRWVTEEPPAVLPTASQVRSTP